MSNSLFLLTLELPDTDDRHWLFRDRPTALAWLTAYLRADKKAGQFDPGVLSVDVQDGCPRRSIPKIVAWLDQHGGWPYNDEVWFMLTEVGVVESVPRTTKPKRTPTARTGARP